MNRAWAGGRGAERRVIRALLMVVVLAWVLVLAAGCGGGSSAEPDRSEGSGDVAAGDDGEGAGPGGGAEETAEPADGPAAPAGSGTASPEDFPLPVGDAWTLVGDGLRGSTRVVIFRFEGDRDASQAQYAESLTGLGLSVNVDGFRISAQGEVDGRPVDAEVVFQRMQAGDGEMVQVTVSLRDWAQ
ncbi:MAG TPA: hypothetical protein VF282_00370 [Bacillota bacterium]